MRWAIYGVVALLTAALVGAALFPLSLALDLVDAPIEGTPSGTVWRGQIADASYGGRPLGQIEVEAGMLATLIGAREAEIAVDGPLGTGSAHVAADDTITTITGLDAVVQIEPLGFLGPFGERLSGEVAIIGDAAFGPLGCTAGDLTVTTDALARSLGRLGAEGFSMTGPVTCEDGVMVADLAGGGAEGSAQALLRLKPGAYVTELTVDPTSPAAGQALAAYGFQRRPEGYTMVTRGTW